MITKVYISHCQEDELLALELAQTLWSVNLESLVAVYRRAQAIALAERIRFGMRQSDCVVAILTLDGVVSPLVNQEIGLASGMDHLIVPLLERGAEMPTLIRHLKPLPFGRNSYADAVGEVIRNMRDLTRLEWLKIKCPKCGEEMTQYLPPQEEVEKALLGRSCLDTICTYCEAAISLDPRTLWPL